MSDINSINLFLDENLVDELWTLAKRDGLLVEKVREASTKIAANVKFGLGKLWQWMTADLEAELIRCRRLNTSLGVIVCSVDGLKHIYWCRCMPIHDARI